MDIDVMEMQEIKQYFLLDERIQRINEYKKMIRDEFYSRTMATVTYPGDLALTVKSVRMENEVVDLVDCLSSKDEVIRELKQKQRFFQKYLHTLPQDERIRLRDRYRCNGIPETVEVQDYRLYEEVEQIEDAINLMFGYPDDVKEVVKDRGSLEDNVKGMAELLGV